MYKNRCKMCNQNATQIIENTCNQLIYKRFKNVLIFLVVPLLQKTDILKSVSVFLFSYASHLEVYYYLQSDL